MHCDTAWEIRPQLEISKPRACGFFLPLDCHPDDKAGVYLEVESRCAVKCCPLVRVCLWRESPELLISADELLIELWKRATAAPFFCLVSGISSEDLEQQFVFLSSSLKATMCSAVSTCLLKKASVIVQGRECSMLMVLRAKLWADTLTAWLCLKRYAWIILWETPCPGGSAACRSTASRWALASEPSFLAQPSALHAHILKLVRWSVRRTGNSNAKSFLLEWKLTVMKHSILGLTSLSLDLARKTV